MPKPASTDRYVAFNRKNHDCIKASAQLRGCSMQEYLMRAAEFYERLDALERRLAIVELRLQRQ